MHVYILTSYKFPLGFSSAQRILCYAKGLQANGVPCCVVTTSCSSPEKEGSYEGVTYRSFIRSECNNPSVFRKLIYKGWTTVRSYGYCLSKIGQGDTLILYSSDIFSLLVYRMIAYVKRFRIYLELCEYPYFQNTFANRIRRKITFSVLFPRYDGFIAISEDLYKLAESHKSRLAKVVKIPILIDLSRNRERETIHEVSFPYKSLRYIFYAGVISEYKDGVIGSIKAFIEASRRLKNPVYYIFAGPESGDLHEIYRLMDAEGLRDKVIYAGTLLPEEVMVYFRHATLFISNKYDNIQNRNGFSTKLGEALLAGIPVLTTTVGEPKYYLQNNVSGYIVEPCCQEALRDKIVEAFSDEDKRLKIAKTGKEVAEKQFDCILQGKNLALYLTGKNEDIAY